MEASEISSASLCICCVVYELDVTISQEIQYEIITFKKPTDTSTVKRHFGSLRVLSASHFTSVLCADNSVTWSRWRPWKGLQLLTCVASLRLAFVLLGPKHNSRWGVFSACHIFASGGCVHPDNISKQFWQNIQLVLAPATSSYK